MDKTSIMAEFSIYGEHFNPSKISLMLNLTPSIAYQKGDLIAGKSLLRKETSWSIEIDYAESLDINESLEKIVSILIAKKQILKYIKKNHEVKLLFMFVIRVKNNEIPAMYFNEEFIEFAGEISAEIGFDMYIY